MARLRKQKTVTTVIVTDNNEIIVPRAFVESKLHISPNQMDIISILIAQIGLDSDIDSNLIYSLSARDFASLKGYTDVRTADKTLRDRVCGSRNKKGTCALNIWIELLNSNGDFDGFNFFEHISYRNGIATFELTKYIKEFFVTIKHSQEYKIFAKLKYILPLASQYSKHLYLMCKEFLSSGKRFCDTDWELFLDKLGVPTSMAYSQIKTRVLEKAKEEINMYSDIIIDYKIDEISVKGGKKPIAIKFTIMKKDSCFDLDNNIRKNL